MAYQLQVIAGVCTDVLHDVTVRIRSEDVGNLLVETLYNWNASLFRNKIIEQVLERSRETYPVDGFNENLCIFFR